MSCTQPFDGFGDGQWNLRIVAALAAYRATEVQVAQASIMSGKGCGRETIALVRTTSAKSD
jgi:hypothetical protein